MAGVEILNQRLPMVAVVGRPNVGKSTFFNSLIRRRKAVVLDTPGVTRDRNMEPVEWGGRRFLLVDTGGYETEPRDKVFAQMREQCMLAIEEADLILLMTDVTEPDHPVDEDMTRILRRTKKPVVLVVNKCDNTKRYQESFSFSALGFSEQFPISAVSGSGIGDLLERVLELLPRKEEEEGLGETGTHIAVVGRQNVGKSSLVNALLRRERVIACDLPGTTRDTIDTHFRYNDRIYTLIDTAGIRRRGKVKRGIEKLSVMSAQASLQRCDVALIVLDAEQGLTEQDQRVAGYAFEAHRPCILVVNKWDLLEKEDATAGAFAKTLRREMGYLSFAPILMISASTGQRVQRLFPLIDRVVEESRRRIDTPNLNEWLKETLIRQSPPVRKGRYFRIKYVAQTGVRPPTFTFFVNDPALMHFSYERYLINRLREAYGFEGVPIRIRMKRKSKRDAMEAG